MNLYNYETLFIINSILSENQKNIIIEKIKTIIEKNSNNFKVDLWGNRKLAYKINHQSDGYYVYISFETNKSFPNELDRIFKITDGIVRSIIISK